MIDLSKVTTKDLAKELNSRKRARINDIVTQLTGLFEELSDLGVAVVDMEENYIQFTGTLDYNTHKSILSMQFKEDF